MADKTLGSLQKKVLIADDDAVMRSAVKKIMQKIAPGFEIQIAEDGQMALEMISKSKYNLLITDVIMPKMDGKALVGSIAKLPKENRPDFFLIVSGLLTGGIRKIGGTTFFPKPFTPADLKIYLISTFGPQPIAPETKAPDEVKIDSTVIEWLSLGLIHTCESLFGTKAVICKPKDQSIKIEAAVDISVVSCLNSSKYRAVLIIRMPKSTFLKLVERMLGATYEELTEDLQDAAAEINNQIIGYAKVKLNTLQHDHHAAIHTVITGDSHRVVNYGCDYNLIQYFETEVGVITMEVVGRKDLI